MQSFKDFIKRNVPVFFLGLIITLVFVAIILSQPDVGNNVPAGFKKVEEKVFESGKPKEPETKETKPTEYAPQIASPDNKGKPYFYGEYDPNSRDDAGYPIPPVLGSTKISSTLPQEDLDTLKAMEMEKREERLKPTRIDFTETGFLPTDANGYTGVEIIWTNKTITEITIYETVPTHEALKNGVTIKPGGSFSFRPLRDRLFTYIEAGSKKYGTVLVGDVTLPLLKGLGGE